MHASAATEAIDPYIIFFPTHPDAKPKQILTANQHQPSN